MKTIEIIVSPDGATQLETKGYSGAECQAASRFMEQALGKPSTETLKPEFHTAQNQHHHTNQEN